MLSDVARRVRASEIAPPTAGDPPELGGYEIRGRLGQGGMGVVYLGATRSGRPLAIKVIHIDDAETITWEYAPGPRIWIGGDRAAHRVRVTVTAEREGYRPAEFHTTFTLPDEWVPAE